MLLFFDCKKIKIKPSEPFSFDTYFIKILSKIASLLILC